MSPTATAAAALLAAARPGSGPGPTPCPGAVDDAGQLRGGAGECDGCGGAGGPTGSAGPAEGAAAPGELRAPAPAAGLSGWTEFCSTSSVSWGSSSHNLLELRPSLLEPAGRFAVSADLDMKRQKLNLSIDGELGVFKD